MLPLRLFRSRAFAAGNAAIFLTFASLFGAVFFLAQFLQTGLGYGAARRRPAAAAVDGDAVLRRAGRRARSSTATASGPFMVAGLLLQAIGLGWIALIADAGHGLRAS